MTEGIVNERIGKNVKRYRLLYSANNSSMTQKELASRIGVSVSLIGALESSKINQGISVFNLYKISEVLGVSIDEFFK